jgi:eukaryotic-like serine/threonine-protein kinase
MRQPPSQLSGGENDDTTQVGPQVERVRAPTNEGTRGDMLGDRYEQLAVIGSGGGGVVFRARDRVTGTLVAVKTASQVDPQTAALFEREARVLSLLRHAAIVKYLDHGLTPYGAPYLVMELLAGENLRERLNHGPLDAASACLLTARMLDALACAHERGVVHRDYKPSNVFLPGGDLAQAKLLDFGVAREVHGWLRTLTGQVMGTPLYMAPEQALGKPDLDGRADIFAAGCVLIECITGKPVFSGVGSAGLAKLALADSVVPTSGLEQLPTGLAELAMRMLAKDPFGRPSDAAALAMQLRAIADTIEPMLPSRKTAGSLGAREARPVVVLMVGPVETSVDVDADNRRLAEIVGRWGGEAQSLVSGSCLVTFGVGGARELGVRAARAALELRAEVIGRTLALALGRATVEGRVGAAIDETTRLVGMTPNAFATASSNASVFVDADLAELLSEQFEVLLHRTDAGATYELVNEQSVTTASRLVMGKKVPFVGRDRELRSLEALVAECFDEPRCGAAVVISPAGGGKSRLRRELLSRVNTEHDALVTLIGAADAFRAGAPYEVLGAAFRQAARIAKTETALEQCRKMEAFVLETAPNLTISERERVSAFLCEMSGLEVPGHLAVLLLSARQDPRTMADQVRVAWLDWLAAALSESPVLLVVEDLHWGDAPSVQLIEAAMKLYRTRPFVVVAFARPEVNARFANLWRDLADRVTLPPLRAKAARDLLKAVLPELSEKRAIALIERADGNPFFLEELIRAESSQGESSDHLTPATVLAALQGRLDQVGDAGKRVLRAGAVFGETFSAEAVRALLPLESRGDVGEWLEVLANAELVVPPDDRVKTGDLEASDERWQFRHALIRDAAYDTLTDSDRRVGHKLAASYLYDRGERDGVVLASHYERGGETSMAVVQWRVAAEQSLEANDLEGVADRCARADALGPQGEELGRVRLVACRAFTCKGDWPAGEAEARKALPWLGGIERGRALAELAFCLFYLQRYDEACEIRAELSAEAQVAGRSSAWAFVLLRGSCNLKLLPDGAVRLGVVLEEIRELALEGDFRLQGMWHTLSGEVCMMRGRTVEALVHIQRGTQLFEQVGDLAEVVSVRNNLAFILTDLGRIDEAEAQGMALLSLAKRIGSYLVPIVQANLACLALAKRDCDLADAFTRELLASELAKVDPRVAGFGHILLAQSSLERLNGVSALDFAQKATQILQQTPSQLLTAEAALARALLMVGRSKEARIYAESSLATLRKLGTAEHGEFMIWLAAVECLSADGALTVARQVATDSLAALNRRLDLLERAEDRPVVLAALPDAALLAKQARLLGIEFPVFPQRGTSEPANKPTNNVIRGEA